MSFGNAFGAFVPRRGGGSGPTSPAFAPRYVVGNALLGDTTADCDFLDPGNGVGIRNAVNAATLVPGDIWIRPGTYDFNLDPAPASTITVQPGIRIWGAGSSTVLVAPSSGNPTLFELVCGFGPDDPVFAVELANLRFELVGYSGPIPNDPCLISVRGSYGFGSSIHDVIFRAANEAATPQQQYRLVQVSPATADFSLWGNESQLYGGTSTGNLDGALVHYYSANAGSNPALGIYVENCTFVGGDYQIGFQGHNPFLRDTQHFLSNNELGAAIILSPIGENPTVLGARVTLDGCSGSCGIRSTAAPGGFGQPGNVNGALISSCVLKDRSGPFANNIGIDIVGPVGAGLPNYNAVVAANSVASFASCVRLLDTQNCIVALNTLRDTLNAVEDNTDPNSVNELAHNMVT